MDSLRPVPSAGVSGHKAGATEEPAYHSPEGPPPSSPGPVALREALRRAGLRSTQARIAVLERLYLGAGPVSHAELADLLTPLGFDRATVYRNLMDLVTAGLASRADRGDHVWRFELTRADAHARGEHPHFVCTDCGTVACLPEVALPVPTPAQSNVIAHVDEIVIRGQCQQCG